MATMNQPPAISAGVKSTAAGSSASSGQNVTKRLRSELMGLMMSNTPGISAFPESDSNILDWVGTIKGVDDTPYSGKDYRISIHFPNTYPYTAPTIKFTTPMFHPNVAYPQGDICLDILKEKWSAVYSVQTILVSLQSLLGEPNNDSPLNIEAAELWDDKSAFKTKLDSTYKAL